MSNQPPPNWYPDPSGRHEKRYWDGTAWTNRVMNGGKERGDAKDGTHDPSGAHSADRVQQQGDPAGRPRTI